MKTRITIGIISAILFASCLNTHSLSFTVPFPPAATQEQKKETIDQMAGSFRDLMSKNGKLTKAQVIVNGEKIAIIGRRHLLRKALVMAVAITSDKSKVNNYGVVRLKKSSTFTTLKK